QSRKPLRAAIARDEAELHLRLTELRCLGGDADVARHGELAPAAQGEAVYRRNRWFGRRLESTKDLLTTTGQPPSLERAETGQLGDVGAGDERASRTGENHRSHIVPRDQVIDSDTELADGSG